MTRKVTVVDTAAPVIALKGSATTTVVKGTAFIDAGVTVTDTFEGDLTANVVVGGATVDTSTEGEYIITYNVSDTAGNAAAEVTRKVTVTLEPDTTAPVITLTGDADLAAEAGVAFVDPGFTASDDRDGDLTAKVTVGGDTVDSSNAGVYTLTYDVSDSAGNAAVQVTRTVTVADTVAPVITLVGDAEVSHEAGTDYTDTGASAADVFEGDLTAKLTTDNPVDTSKPGDYVVTYRVSDSSGNEGVLTRKVSVADTVAPALILVGEAIISHEAGVDYTDAGVTAMDSFEGDLAAKVVKLGTVDTSEPGDYTLTYNVSDSSGNAATEIKRTVTVADTTAPVLTLKGSATATVFLGKPYVDAGASATDSFEGDLTAKVAVGGDTVDTSTEGVYTLTYNVSDSAGNAAVEVTRKVTVTQEADVTGPVITLVGKSELSAEAGVAYADPGYGASDDRDGDLTAKVVVGGDTVDTSVLGVYTVTYNVSDTAGNAAVQVTRTVAVADTTAPVITLTDEAEVSHEAGTDYTDAGASAADVFEGDLTAKLTTDNPVDTSKPGEYVVTYRVSDGAGNEGVLTRKVTVSDSIAPTLVLIGDTAVSHEGGTDYTDAGVTATDSFEGDLVAKVQVTGSVDTTTLGEYTLTYDLSDAAGNSAATVTRKVTVVDTAVPVIALKGSATTTVVKGTAFADPGVTVTDVFEGDLTANVVVGGATVDTSTEGEYIITYNVSDTAGNVAAEVTRKVTVTLEPDTTAPVITLTGDAALAAEAGVAFVDPGFTASDDRDGDLTAKVTVGGDTVDSSTAGVYTLTYDVSDAAGNAAVQITRTVTVADTVAPVITLVGDAEVSHEAGTDYTDTGASAADVFEGDLTAKLTTDNPVDTSKPGDYVVTYRVSDSSGNEGVLTRKVTVADTIAPALALVGEAIISHEAGVDYTDAGVTATDSFEGDLAAKVVKLGTVDTSEPGDYTLTYNVSDSSGNAATEIKRTVTVADTTAPVLTLKGSATATVFLGKPYVDAGASATDSYEGDLTAKVAVGGDTVDTSTEGVYSLTYNVSDSTGNAAVEVTRKVTVTQEADTTIPVITILGEAEVTAEAGVAYTDLGATAGDDRDGDLTAKIVVGGDTVDTSALGVYSLTYDVTDLAGNKASQVTRKVTVTDTTAPIVTPNGQIEVTVEGGSTYTDAGATASDSFDGDVTASLTTDNPVDTAKLGEYTVTLTAKDSSGNVGSSTRRVTVVDTTSPVIVLKGEASITVANGSTYTDAGATASDSIDGDLTDNIVLGGDSVDTSQAGTYTVTFNVIDLSGNKATEVSRTVVVSADTVPPVITLNGEAIVVTELGGTYNDAGATAIDNVDGDVSDKIVVGGDTVDASKAGTYTVTYNVTDAVGNKATEVIRTVTVSDNTIPVITLSGDSTIIHEVGTDYTDAGATATDNIDGDLTASIIFDGTVDTSKLGEYSLSYDVTDAAGNNAIQVTRKVTVADTIAPVITLTGDAEIPVEVKTSFIEPGYTVMDAFEGDLTANVTVDGSVDVQTPGEYILTYSVSDSAGNKGTATRKVTVADTTRPIILTTVGPRFIILTLGTPYEDKGAIALDSYEGNISAKITVNNPVDVNKTGIYNITYSVKDAAGNESLPLSRTVRIIDPVDPILSLRGQFAVKLKKGDTYSDEGATATDNYDGDITGEITVDNPVDTSKTGVYKITYTVQDTSGNEASASRTVIVASEPQGYVDWLASSGLDKLPLEDQIFTADPDNDGTSNLLEYFFGGSPVTFDNLRPSLSFDPASGDIAFSFRKRKDLDDGWSFEINRRKNFNTSNAWADALVVSPDFPAPDITNEDNGDDTTTETYTYKGVGSSSAMYFLQLIIDYEE